MPVSHEHRVIFVHIPKTAGTSIEWAFGMHGTKTSVGLEPQGRNRRDYHHLWGKGLQHLTISGIEEHLLALRFRDYGRLHALKRSVDVGCRFLGIKVPSRVMSFYANVIRDYFSFAVVRHPYDRFLSHCRWLVSRGYWVTDRRDFSEQVSDYVGYIYRNRSDLSKVRFGVHLIPQHEFITQNREIAVDRVLRFENLSHDFSSLSGELGIELALPHRMVGEGIRNHQEAFRPEDYDRVCRIYTRDFDLFDYDSSPPKRGESITEVAAQDPPDRSAG